MSIGVVALPPETLTSSFFENYSVPRWGSDVGHLEPKEASVLVHPHSETMARGFFENSSVFGWDSDVGLQGLKKILSHFFLHPHCDL